MIRKFLWAFLALNAYHFAAFSSPIVHADVKFVQDCLARLNSIENVECRQLRYVKQGISGLKALVQGQAEGSVDTDKFMDAVMPLAFSNLPYFTCSGDKMFDEAINMLGAAIVD